MADLSNPLLASRIIKVEYLVEAVDINDLEIDADSFGAISKSAFQKVKISWPEQLGADHYNVYGSPSPLNRTNRLNTSKIKATEFIFVVPVMPPTILLYFWVSRVNAVGGEFYLDDDPTTNIDELADLHFDVNPITAIPEFPLTGPLNQHMKYIFETIRRRHRWLLEQDGEVAYLYLRRWTGAQCKCTGPGESAAPESTPESMFSSIYRGNDDRPGQVKNPDYQALDRCPICFSTGIVGGYYPKVTLRVRYGGVPVRVINYRQYGVETIHTYDAWTLWAPKVSQFDVLVRPDGQRFTATQPGQSEMRTGPFHQEMNFTAIQPSDIRQQITDELIYNATHENQFLPVGTKIFG